MEPVCHDCGSPLAELDRWSARQCGPCGETEARATKRCRKCQGDGVSWEMCVGYQPCPKCKGLGFIR